ncbi:phosphate ABC transporter substrate-binding protein [Neobacillus sp. PS3-12]|uniref:phosphate ABC transporter substrate-binding protein n=1 Tax=Neobacillus sp. PS3-12 TaxID=3070677 RepID=UPI0027E10D10|nr:phosphate ABC transporter substrate-binding protein [Neobacillus sp. PS3-12]WML54074.1 phosphate ABC transporter substrate-binding protein [Neobacillus sp. PS3-12]
MKMFKKLGLPLVIAALMVVMAACGGGTSNKTTDTSKQNDNKTAQKADLSGSLVLSGSTALQPLASAAGEQFMNTNSKVSIQVNGGGSGTGLSQVSQGAVQIGNSDVFAEEKNISGLVDNKVAVVGMTAAVNPKVGITDIKKDDLIKVFTGKITNWKELGGPDQKITLVNRPESSGTRAVFNKFALDGATPAEGITEDASNTVKKIISETPGAIGYLALSYFTDKTVTQMSIDGVKATPENIQSGKFPVWAYEHMYTKGNPTDLEKAFLDYMMSDEVQNKILPQQGYLPVTKMKVQRDSTGKLTNK